MNYDSLYRTTVHEAAHALRAHALGWRVLWLRASAPHDGSCGIEVPLQPDGVQAAYALAPTVTHGYLVQILSVSGAPGAVLHEPVDGADLVQQLAYRRAWDATGCPIGWLVLRHEAQHQLRAWANTPGRVEQVHRLGALLERRRFLSATEFQAFVSPGQSPRLAPRPVPHRAAPCPAAEAPREQTTPREPEDLAWDLLHPYGSWYGGLPCRW
jgi:hypothetical protein